jgi:hypothetical protein
VLRFVIQMEGGKRLPVEMRSHQLRGVLGDGDRVRVVAGLVNAGTLRPRQVENLTTGGIVEAWSPTGLRRVAGVLGLDDLRTAVISAAVATGFGFAGRALMHHRGGPSGGRRGSRSQLDVDLQRLLSPGVLLTVGIVALFVAAAAWTAYRPPSLGERLFVALVTGAGLGTVASALLTLVQGS